MKRLALVAAVLVVAACSTKETPKADTAAPAMAPAPAAAPADTGMKMDSASMKMDSAAAKMDTAAKKADTGSCHASVSPASTSIRIPLVISTEATKRSTRRIHPTRRRTSAPV